MRASVYYALAVTLFSGALIGSGPRARAQQASTPEGPRLGEAAPDFTLSNIGGKRVRLKDYRGKKHVALVFYPALFRAGG